MNQNVEKNLSRFQKDLYQEYVTNAITNNESPLVIDYATTPVLQKVLELLPASFQEIPLQYLPAQSKEIIAKISKETGLPETSIFLTAGAEDALRVISRIVLSPETKVFIPFPTFPRLLLYPTLAGSPVTSVILDSASSLQWKTSLLRSIEATSADVVYLTNPNNPTGFAIALHELISFCATQPEKFFVIDASLNNFLDEKQALSLLKNAENVSVVFSFSKSFGIPGLRVGFVVSANTALLTALDKVQSPLQISSASLAILEELLHKTGEMRNILKIYRDKIQSNFSLLQKSLPESCYIIGEPNYNCVVASRNSDKELSEYLTQSGYSIVEAQTFPGLEKSNGVRVILNQDNFEEFCRILRAY